MINHFTELFSLRHPEEFFIGGHWVKPQGAQRFYITDPATGRVIGSCPAASVADIERPAASIMTHNDRVNDIQFPLGGFKQSGIGRDGGPEGLALYQETKVVFMDSVPPSVHPVP